MQGAFNKELFAWFATLCNEQKLFSLRTFGEPENKKFNDLALMLSIWKRVVRALRADRKTKIGHENVCSFFAVIIGFYATSIKVVCLLS